MDMRKWEHIVMHWKKVARLSALAGVIFFVFMQGMRLPTSTPVTWVLFAPLAAYLVMVTVLSVVLGIIRLLKKITEN